MRRILCCTAMLLSLLHHTAVGGTRTVTFDWEDGTSTILSQFVRNGAGGVSENVTEGSEIDYGPSADPFSEPVGYDVTPFGGERMLQYTETPLGDGAQSANAILGFVENLSDGDTVEFSFMAFDPSDGRSPSVLANAIYGQSGDVDSFAGFLTPFQDFPAGTGWLHVEADAAPDGSGVTVDPQLVFDSDGGTRNAAIIRTAFFHPTLAFTTEGDDDYNFFIDDLTITVTSDNPDAQITLPDGSVTLVNGGGGQLIGDYDDSDQVSQADLDIVLLNWGDANFPGNEANIPPGGGTFDGQVSQNELDGVLLNWGNTASPAGSTVPEPTSLGLLALAGLYVATRRRGE